MSKDTKEIQLSDEEWEMWEKLAKKNGLTVQEQVNACMLNFFYYHDKKIFDEMKQTAKPQVLRAFEKHLKLE